MKFRVVDVMLMVGLFLVGAAILWTLFTLGNDRSRPARTGDEPQPPAVSVPADADGAGGVQAVPPGQGEVPTTVEGSSETGPDATPSVVAEQGEEVGPVDPTQEAEPEVEPPDEIVSGDPVPLQRVGFSFTTGGAGACGIVLEAWEHVAVSRDLLAVYGCGAEVTLELAESVAGRSEVSLVIADTMNPQFTRTANIYVAPDEPANQYGITEGVLRP